MPDTTKLRRKDVRKEVKRIQKLPEYERERQMKALRKRVIDEIHSTSARVMNDQHSIWKQGGEAWKMFFYFTVLPKDYRKSIYKIWNKAFTNNVNYTSASNAEQIVKTKTAHVSGLPLPEQAEVDIWWQEDKLILQSRATEFSLPVERVLGMGITKEMSAYAVSGDKTYLTIEYKKEDEIKCIVVRVTWKLQVSHLIEYFNQIKGTREMNRQEL